MEFLVQYGMLIVIGLIILAYGIYKATLMAKMTPEQRLEEVKDIVRKLVEQADNYAGSETGQEKLRMVYAQFTKQYPALAMAITFEQFADFVEKVLSEVRLDKKLQEQRELDEYVAKWMAEDELEAQKESK